MQLAEAQAAELAGAQAAAAEELLDAARPRSNVRGVGVGVKWSNGQPTGEPALVVLVNQKLPKSAVAKADLIPAKLGGAQTDVLSIGEVFAGGVRRMRRARSCWRAGSARRKAATASATSPSPLAPLPPPCTIFCPEAPSHRR
jgi:hypothetical protein